MLSQDKLNSMEKQAFIVQSKSRLNQRVKFLAGLLVNPQVYRKFGNALSNPSVLDKSLGTLCYFLLFISSIIRRYPKLKKIFINFLITLKSLYKQTINRMFNYESTPIKADIEPKKLEITDDDSSADKLPEDLKKLYDVTKGISGYITDIRTFHRGFSIPGSIADILEASSLLKEGDYLNYFSTICISLYQPCETIAFMMDHNWLFPGGKNNNPDWWYIISTKFWFVWVVAEFAQSAYRIFISKRGKDVSKGELIEFIEHFATLPLCAHWSSESGCLSDLMVGFFATIAGGLSTIDTWKGIFGEMSKDIGV